MTDENPTAWGAELVTMDPCEWGAEPVQEEVPRSFYERWKRGTDLARILDRAWQSAKEGFGSEDIGYGWEALNKARRDAQDYRILPNPDYLSEHPFGLPALNSAVFEAGAHGADFAMRALSAGIYGAAGAFGHVVGELSGSESGRAKADRDMMMMGQMGLIAAGMGDRATFARHGPDMDLQPIGGLPKPDDFDAAATVLTGERIKEGITEPPAKEAPRLRRFKSAEMTPKGYAEQNLRDLWDERGIHPAEAAHDAQSDAFLKADLTNENPEPHDRSGLVTPTNSPVPEGTPRTELAKTGKNYIDDVLESGSVKRAVDNPVIDRSGGVPGGVAIGADGRALVDRNFPASMTVDGVEFDPAEPLVVRATVDRRVTELLTGEMDAASATRAAGDFAAQAESAWYEAHGIDQAKADAALHLDVLAQANRDAEKNQFRPQGTPAELERAKEIVAKAKEDGELQPTIAGADKALGGPPEGSEAGAAVTPASMLPPLSVQPPPRPGSLIAMAKSAAMKLLDAALDIQQKVAPMAGGSAQFRSIAKDFANALRRNRWEWQRIDQNIVNSPALKAARDRLSETGEQQRERMWNAMDEESVLQQQGQTSLHMGIATLEPEERAVALDLNARAQLAWMHAKDAGMVEGDGLPFYTPRMLLRVVEMGGSKSALPLNPIGLNLRTRTGQMLHREHLMAEDTELAAKAKFGPDVEIARDVRSLPLAISKLEDAVAGRTLMNMLEEIGRFSGEDTVAVGFKPGPDWFRIEHPAFYKWRPKMETFGGVTAPLKDEAGNIVFEKVPLFVRGDAEGPLRAVLTVPSGKAYGAVMALKAKTMSIVMYTPAIHNLVEFGRAFPAMPLRIFKAYFDGYRAKNNIGLMTEAIDAGLVPIGKRFFNQDITSIMEEPNLAPGRSLTSQLASVVPDLFDPAAGDAVRRGIDKMGDFWHNTLLWDRIADLQMGIYTNMRGDMLRKGMDPQTASRVAAHLANRYAGALPQEAMSASATKISNVMLFSRTFTIGNLGVLKDMFTGLPRDLVAQIERDSGASAAAQAKSFARRKAISTVALDVALAYAGYNLFQVASNVLLGDSTLGEEMHGYVRRLRDLIEDVNVHPSTLAMPFAILSRLGATGENEPGLENRIKLGYMADGTAIYARNPVGKIGEEFMGWTSSPLDTIHNKLSTYARPLLQTFNNDAGFGRRIYDKNAETPSAWAGNIWNIVKHFVVSQTPEGQLQSLGDLVKGEGDPKYNLLNVTLPFVGVTVRKGAPGGPAVGELYHAQDIHRAALDAALPDIRRQILRGDMGGAMQRMNELGVPGGLQKFYLRTTLNPATRLSGKALRDFYQYSTPEQRARMEGAMGR